jgi:hypothetical protein
MLLLGILGLSELLPGDPVLEPWERAAFDLPHPSGAVYQGPPRVDHPVLPVQIWGLRYALDVVLRTTSDQWDMHELARIDLPDRSLWVAKDANTDRVQTIVADIPFIQSWVPEVPVERFSRPLIVDDQSTADWLDLSFSYRNPDDQQVDIHVEGKPPTKPSPHRNGNTMGHSRDSVAALLDLHLFGRAKTATVSYDGVPAKIKKVAGVYPMQILLAQTQGGFAVANAILRPAPSGFLLQRPSTTEPWPTRSEEDWIMGEDGWLTHASSITTQRYHYQNGELDRALVLQAGQDTPVTEVLFQPSVPDLRRPFTGEYVSRFVVDIAGQKAHGIGELHCRWVDSNTVEVDMIPQQPRWFADRPMRTFIRYTPQGVLFVVNRT